MSNNTGTSKKQTNYRYPKKKTQNLPILDESSISNNYSENIKILDTHPLIRKRSDEYKYGQLTVKINTYSLNTRQSKKFGIKTFGDDGIYQAVKCMVDLLPRGLSIVSFYDSDSDSTQTTMLYGFKKFSGMEDDDNSINLKKADKYFRNGTSSDATHFMETEKSNGENAKWTIRRIFGKVWILAGSKNTCKVFPLGMSRGDFDAMFPIVDDQDYCHMILNEVYKIFANPDINMTEFIETIITNQFVIMGELNHVNSEHLYPISRTKIEHVAMLNKHGNEINSVISFSLFDKFKIECVKHRLEPIANIKQRLNEIIDLDNTEGVVINLLKENKSEHESTEADFVVIGLIKYKTSHYVVGRRIRQNFWKILVDPIIKEKLTTDEAIQEAKLNLIGALKSKIPKLTFLINFKNNYKEWVQLGIGFAEWWTTNYLSMNKEKRTEYLKLAKIKYGTIYNTYYDIYKNLSKSK
jgi:hypothetical protein